MTFSVARCWVLALAAGVGSLSLISGCVSEEGAKDAAGGMTGTGTGGSGTTMSGGSTSTGQGGSTGSADPDALACPAIAEALITDFSAASFGDAVTKFSGSSFIYPTDGMYPLVSDLAKGDWHVTGTVGAYSGLGVATYLLVMDTISKPCTKIDASKYKGISFKISGSVPGSAGTTNSVTLWVQTAANDITSAWKNMYTSPTEPVHNFGRCTPTSMGTPTGNDQYNGTCSSPSKVIPVTATPTEQKVMWADLTGGKPAATVNPAEIVGFGWNLPAPTGVDTATVMPYELDLVIDDVKFIE